jgi:hypothetical protein
MSYIDSGIFTNMVDELVLEMAPFDNELDEGLKYLDERAQKEGITFYEKIFQVLHQYDIDERAKEWNSHRI